LHELSVVFEVVKAVEKIAFDNHITEVDTIVLQIGEISSMIPRYVEECFPAAIDGTFLEKTKLRIEILTATGLCRECDQVFKIVESEGECPDCHTRNWELLSGKEFMIKEIVVAEN